MHDQLSTLRKLCECGCGGIAPIAQKTSRRNGWVQGEPLRFILGHRGKLNAKPRTTRPCACECGTQITTPDARGRERHFAKGHRASQWERRYAVEDRGYISPCWIWQGGVNAGGYGPYRAIYQRVVGSVPPGLDLDHLCRVRACVNPTHLEPVTRSVNLLRGARARLTDDDVAAIRAAVGVPLDDLAQRYDITRDYACRVRNGRTR